MQDGGAASPLECLFSGEKETCYLLITAKIRGAPTETESAAINGGVATLRDPSLSRYNAPPLLAGRNDCGRYVGRFSPFEIACGIQIVQPSGKYSVSRQITLKKKKKKKDERPKSQLGFEAFMIAVKQISQLFVFCCPACVPSVDDSFAAREKRTNR